MRIAGHFLHGFASFSVSDRINRLSVWITIRFPGLNLRNRDRRSLNHDRWVVNNLAASLGGRPARTGSAQALR